MKQLTCIAFALGLGSASWQVDYTEPVSDTVSRFYDTVDDLYAPGDGLAYTEDQLRALDDRIVPELIQQTGGPRPIDADPSRIFPDNGRPELVNSRPGTAAEAYRVANLAILSYCPVKTLSRWMCRPCRRLGSGVEVVDHFVSFPYRGLAVLLRDTRRKEIVVSFRGSINLPNWVENLVPEQTGVPYARGARVHYGFKELNHELMGYYLEPLKRLLGAHPTYRVIFTGHSLGGALSTMAAAELGYRRIVAWDRMATFTYGEPRVGNAVFARWLNAQKLQMTRVVNEGDLVPHLVVARANYVHHATELYIRNNRTTVCSTRKLEDINCSLSRFPTVSILNHLQAWDLAMGIFGC